MIAWPIVVGLMICAGLVGAALASASFTRRLMIQEDRLRIARTLVDEQSKLVVDLLACIQRQRASIRGYGQFDCWQEQGIGRDS